MGHSWLFSATGGYPLYTVHWTNNFWHLAQKKKYQGTLFGPYKYIVIHTPLTNLDNSSQHSKLKIIKQPNQLEQDTLGQ